MKRALLVAMASWAMLSAKGQISTTGLVAQWRFTGNVLDSSGNGHNGTATAISYTAGRDGLANTAALFNSPTSYITVPYAADLNVTNYSICAIIKPSSFNTGSCQASMILERVRPGSSLSGFYALGFTDNAFDSNCNAFDTSKYVFFTAIGSNAPSYASGQYSPTIRTNQWTSVVATYNGGTTRVYVNGVFKSSQPAPGAIGTNLEGLGIGTSPSQSGYRFSGAMDDLRLYNRVLTDSEIYIYHNPPVPNGVAAVPAEMETIVASPNPATDLLTIHHTDIAAGTFEIVDGLGRSAMTGTLSDKETVLDISSLAPGLYFIRTASGIGASVERFVKR